MMLAGGQLVRGGVDTAIAQTEREGRSCEIKGNCHGMRSKKNVQNIDMCIIIFPLMILDGV